MPSDLLQNQGMLVISEMLIEPDLKQKEPHFTYIVVAINLQG